MPQPLIDLVDEYPDGMDIFHVANQEKDRYYCWLNKKPENIERAKNIFGYVILGEKDKESALVPPNAVGERSMGDVVLAYLPKARYEKIMRLKQEKANSQLNAANDAWKENVRKVGLSVDESTKTQKLDLKVGEEGKKGVI